MNNRQSYPHGRVGDALFEEDLRVATPSQREQAVLLSIQREQERHLEFLNQLVASVLRAQQNDRCKH